MRHKTLKVELNLVSFGPEDKKEDALWVLTIPELQFSVAGSELKTCFMRASAKIKHLESDARITGMPF